MTGLAPRGGGWLIERGAGEPLEVDAVVVASGGLSVPKTGSDGLGVRIVEALGHTIHPPYPALTPLIAEPPPFRRALGRIASGLDHGARRFGPGAGLRRISLHPSRLQRARGARCLPRRRPLGEGGGPPASLRVRWTALDDRGWEEALRPDGARTVGSTLRRQLPDRLAEALLETAGIDPACLLARLRREDRLRLIELLVRGSLPWTGHEGYRRAEVTGGGVSLSELDPRTMESRKHRGLFLCGEILDAFGPIGGYNFLWAWATGRAAGIGATAA